MSIRPAIAADTATLLGFIRELATFEKLSHQVTATEETLRDALFGDNAKAYALMAEVNGTAAGFCVYFYNFSTFVGRPGIYIEDIYVTPEHRSHGIGKQFFQYLAAQATRENCGRVEWSVLDWNQRAIDFYTSMGAEAMSEWIIYRLPRDIFASLAQAQKEVA